MKLDFWKMHGASNDFILLDDRSMTFPSRDKEWIARIAARRTGIGCEGIILIQPSTRADFRMRFFNPDGSEVEMCGNGARCVARLAYEIGAAPQQMTIDTVAGVLRAECNGNQVRLFMTTPRDWRLNHALEAAGTPLTIGFVNSGVPHAVAEIPDLAACDVARLGAAIRYHPDFKPAGTNANFVQITGPSTLNIRTYERGVEAETLACGTGIVASALVMARAGKVKAPVLVKAASGDVLTVDFKLSGDSATDVTLLGPAAHVFTGVITTP
ncbi:MAG: diaminopimelate epimerase [Lentisphaerae bacterium RIFOXYC12_FULL_60_16]|nr:MAG: diaminopimelate epimerase [Lentisphaerae bacterium RIFOXYC12_FULL_60_16]OGV73103.1 MAG: diaminopimelate epimerase [Lentisphaerae bacterium RIFOXYA12_FULL_60_10]OGV85445.1 MAG: diaminopimelate epimerase [Lentisphaerae bacterium RIFOXYB12_FULL_60_10]